MNENRNFLPIQPKWPLRVSNIDGPYESVVKISNSIQQDLKFLLLSSPGDWPFNMDLGVGFRRCLFEPNLSFRQGEIKQRIENQVTKYLPSVVLEEVNFSDPMEEDSNIIKVIIHYTIPQLCVKNSVVLNLGEDIQIEDGSCLYFEEEEESLLRHRIEEPTEE